jgi:F-type H+-transporting ATPase subunit b
MVLTALAADLRFGLVEISWVTLMQIANTLILFLIMKKLLFKPVTEFMAAREAEIADSIESAEAKNREADGLKAEYQEKLAKSEEEGRTIVRQATQKAENKAYEIKKVAEDEIAHLKVKAQKDIEREHVKAINVLKDDIASMAMMAASKVIEKDIDEKAHKSLVDNFINEVGDTKWQN